MAAEDLKALCTFLQGICQTRDSVDENSLLLDELSLESIGFFELLFFIKSRSGVSLTNNQLFTVLFSVIMEAEKPELSTEQKEGVLNSIDTLDIMAANPLLKLMRVSHLLSMIELLKDKKEACVEEARQKLGKSA